MARLFLTERALGDLAAIDAYSIETWGQRVAGRYMDAFESAFDRLRESPDLLKELAECSGCLRFYRVEKHWLVCDVIGGDVYVLTVKHGQMDLPRRVAELEPLLVHEAEAMRRRISGSDKD